MDEAMMSSSTPSLQVQRSDLQVRAQQGHPCPVSDDTGLQCLITFVDSNGTVYGLLFEQDTGDRHRVRKCLVLHNDSSEHAGFTEHDVSTDSNGSPIWLEFQHNVHHFCVDTRFLVVMEIVSHYAYARTLDLRTWTWTPRKALGFWRLLQPYLQQHGSEMRSGKYPSPYDNMSIAGLCMSDSAPDSQVVTLVVVGVVREPEENRRPRRTQDDNADDSDPWRRIPMVFTLDVLDLHLRLCGLSPDVWPARSTAVSMAVWHSSQGKRVLIWEAAGARLDRKNNGFCVFQLVALAMRDGDPYTPRLVASSTTRVGATDPDLRRLALRNDTSLAFAPDLAHPAFFAAVLGDSVLMPLAGDRPLLLALFPGRDRAVPLALDPRTARLRPGRETVSVPDMAVHSHPYAGRLALAPIHSGFVQLQCGGTHGAAVLRTTSFSDAARPGGRSKRPLPT